MKKEDKIMLVLGAFVLAGIVGYGEIIKPILEARNAAYLASIPERQPAEYTMVPNDRRGMLEQPEPPSTNN